MSALLSRRISIDFANTVTISVSVHCAVRSCTECIPEAKFPLPTYYATQSSQLLKDEISKLGTGCVDKSIMLQIEPDVFNYYVAWLYTGQVFGDLEIMTTMSDNENRMTFNDLMRVYYAAYYLRDKAFRNAVMSATVAFLNRTKYCPDLQRIKENESKLPANSPMRPLLLQYWAMRAEAGCLESDVLLPPQQHLPQDRALMFAALKEVMLLRKVNAGDRPRMVNQFQYRET